jgi:hypothetical protein
MHTRSQTLLIGNPRQERRQQSSLVRSQRGQERVLVLMRHAAHGLKDFLSLRRELQQVDTTVARVLDSPDELSRLQLVDERDQPAWEHAEPIGDLLLAECGRPGDDAQQPDVRRYQPERTEALGKFCRRMGADLRYEKGRRCPVPAAPALRMSGR